MTQRTIKEKIYADMVAAMKARDSLKTDALKMIKAEILKHETSGKDMQTTDEEVLQMLSRAIKQRNEAAEGFEKGGRHEAAEKERKEAEIYKTYLPQQLPENEIRSIVQQTIREVNGSTSQDIGKVMAAIMPKIKGKADGSLVNRLVKELLID